MTLHSGVYRQIFAMSRKKDRIVARFGSAATLSSKACTVFSGGWSSTLARARIMNSSKAAMPAKISDQFACWSKRGSTFALTPMALKPSSGAATVFVRFGDGSTGGSSGDLRFAECVDDGAEAGEGTAGGAMAARAAWASPSSVQPPISVSVVALVKIIFW